MIDLKKKTSPFIYEHKGTILPYRIYIPDTAKKLPLIVFLHGRGESGDDNLATIDKNRSASWIPNKLVSECNLRYYVLIPQCSVNSSWTHDDVSKFIKCIREDNTITQSPKTPKYASALMDLIKETVKKYNIDTKNISICGLSMGGFGTYEMITRYPKYFRNACIICGGGDESLITTAMSTNIWLFHGDKDDIVSPLFSERIYQRLKDAKVGVEYTVYKGGNHGAWEHVYKESEFVPFLLK